MLFILRQSLVARPTVSLDLLSARVMHCNLCFPDVGFVDTSTRHLRRAPGLLCIDLAVPEMYGWQVVVLDLFRLVRSFISRR